MNTDRLTLIRLEFIRNNVVVSRSWLVLLVLVDMFTLIWVCGNAARMRKSW